MFGWCPTTNINLPPNDPPNTFFTAHLAISSYPPYDNTGTEYDPISILNNGTFDAAKYRAYSTPKRSIVFGTSDFHTIFFLLAQSLMSPFTSFGFSGYHRLWGMSQASVVDLYDIEHGRTSVPHSSRLEKWAEDGTTISISIASEMSIHSFLGQVPGSLPSSIQSVHCEDH